ncbi:MAG: CvpA family protein [Clostridia bacterium]|nr:CvpA family protein [Clostridia bacterium]
MNNAPYIVDLILIGIMVLSIFLGKRRGFASIVISVAITLVCIVAAGKFAPVIAKTLNDSVIHGMLMKSIEGKISTAVSRGTATLSGALPDYVIGLCTRSGINPGALISEDTVKNISESVSKAVENTAIIPSLNCVICILAVIVSRVASSLLSGTADALLKVSFIQKANGFLGAVFGAIRGLIIVLLAVLFTSVILGLLPDLKYAGAISESSVYTFFNNFIQTLVNGGTPQ